VDAQAALLSAILMFTESSWSDALRGAMLLRSAYNAFDTLAKTAGVTQGNVAQLGQPLPGMSATEVKAFLAAAGASPAAHPPGSAAATPPPAPAAEGASEAAPAVPGPSQAGAHPPILPATLAGELHTLLPQVHPTVFGGIAFGAGLFNLLLSLLPPSRRSVAEWLGFSGDKAYGLAALSAAAQAGGIASVFATLTLVTFHTSISMFHSRGDGSGLVQAGRLLQRCLVLYPNSAVFLWYLGRWLRAAGSVHAATAAYTRAFHAQNAWTSLQAICRYELAWCCMLTLRFSEAHGHFRVLAEKSSWSKAFCEYAAGVNAQACRCYSVAALHFARVPQMVQLKGGRVPPFELWAQQRAQQFTEAHSSLKGGLPAAPAPLGRVDVPASQAPSTGGGSSAPAGAAAAAGSAASSAGDAPEALPLTAEVHSSLVDAVVVCIEAGTDADTVDASALATHPQSTDAAVTKSSQEEQLDATAAGTVSHWDVLLAEPVLEMAYLWNTFSQSSGLSRFAVQRARAVRAFQAANKQTDLFCKEHLETSDGSGGFLGIGKKAKQCSVAQEGRALLRLVEAAATRALGDTAAAHEAVQAVQAMVESGHIAAESRNNFVHPSVFFEAAMLAEAGGDAAAALQHLTVVQDVIAAHDVHFGNRLSFRAKQSASDLQA